LFILLRCPKNFKDNIIIIICDTICMIIIILSTLVFNEIIILNFCTLNEHTKKEMKKREKMEIEDIKSSSDDEEDNGTEAIEP